ncbi:MAG: hypothetical protein C4527_06115 [Candidatus Omnitrophota bacterium]|jgi:Na+/H+ antiporter NhaC|nr:MAG: hypothetical protein C4527_06115 [Candidatus Omnitrophota bacterium]
MEATFFSLVPPLVAIILCVLLREAILALFVGIVVGALYIYDFSPLAFFRAVDDIIISAFTDRDHAVTIFFTVFMGGLVEILNRSPSAHELIRSLTDRIRTRVRATIIIWFSGMIFFIDDYANALIVGNTYRKIADNLKISREKLAYIVDTTSAPITSLALVSTWIGIEITLISDQLKAEGSTLYTGYGLFISSIPYRFYPLLALFFALMVCVLGRDFGPMLRAERNALKSESQEEDEADLHKKTKDIVRGKKAWLVFLPLLLLLIGSICMLGIHGHIKGAVIDPDQLWQTVINLFSAADPFLCLLWATMISCLIALIIHPLFLKEKLLDVFSHWMEGCRGMFTISVILTLAWSIGDICQLLKTGDYVAVLLGKDFNPYYLPFLTFLFAAIISFATGTSFGTMGILMPIAVPLALRLGVDNPEIIYGAVGSVLGGAIFGDHCSPLSDTTILSSGASGCPVTAHVNTQLPYALLVAAVAGICLAFGIWEPIPPWLMLIVGGCILFGILYFFGKKPENTVENASPHIGENDSR